MSFIYFILMYILVYIPIVIIFALMPYVMKKTISFGIKIPESEYNNKLIVNIRKSYFRVVLVTGIVLSIINIGVGIIVGPLEAIYLLTVFIIVYCIIIFLMYYISWKKSKLIKKEMNWSKNSTNIAITDITVQSTTFSTRPLWFILHILIILGTLLIGILLYDQMPDKVPMNYDFDGRVTNTVNKSYRLLFYAPVIQVSMLLLFSGIYIIIQKSRRTIDINNIEESIEQYKLFKNAWLRFSIFGGVILQLIFFVMQITFIGIINNIGVILFSTLGFTFLLMIYVIYLSIKYGQGGSRNKIHKGKTEGTTINRDDDKYWKIGMFYYNKEDPSIFVAKRFSIGWTANFARPATWLIIILFILLMLGISFGTTLLLT